MMKKNISLIVIAVLITVGGIAVLNSRGKNLPETVNAPAIDESGSQDQLGIATEAKNNQPGKTSLSAGGVAGQGSISLKITTPINGATVTTATIAARGATSPGAEVFVNEAQTIADQRGNFSAPLTLDEGENTIVIFANDADGNFTETELTVNYETSE